MSVRTASEHMAGPIGRDLAHSDDVTQAEFFNAFAEAAWAGWTRDVMGADRQFSAIAERLGPKGRWAVKELAEFVRLHEEDPS